MSEVGVEPRPSTATTVSRAGGIMVASMFLSRLLGLLRDTFVVGHFGLHGLGDSWAIASRIPDLIFMLIAGGGLSSAFIPVFTEFWYTDRRKEAWKVFSVVVTVCSVIAVLLIAGAWMIAPNVAAYAARGVSNDAVIIDKATVLSRIMLPAQFAFLIGSVMLGTLYARKQFVAPAIAPNVYNIGIIVGASILPTFFGFGIEGVAWGALAGAYIGNILIPLLVMIPQGGRFIPSFDVRAPGVGKFFKLLLPVIVGFSLPSMITILTQLLFASRYGVGSNIVLQCSNNLMQAPNGIFGQSLALAAFPVLGQFFAEKRMDMYRSQLSRTMRTVIYLSIPTSVLMFAMAPLITHCIYGFGVAAKEPGQLALIANCLRIYSIGIAAWCIQPVMMRGFFSVHKTFGPIAWSTATTGVFIVLCAIVQNLQMSKAIPWLTGLDIFALPWITNIAVLLLVVVLYRALEGDVGRLDRLGLIRTTAKGLVSSIPLGIVAYCGGVLWSPHGKLASIAWMLLVTCLAAWTYYYVTSWYKMPETEYFDRALKRMRLKR